MESRNHRARLRICGAGGSATHGAASVRVVIAGGALACALLVVVLLVFGGGDEKGEASESDSTERSSWADARREAMDAAITRTDLLHLGRVEHFTVRTWPYVIFIEDFGSDRANERHARYYTDRVSAFYRYAKQTYPLVAGKDPVSPLRIIVLKDRASFTKFNAANGLGFTDGDGPTRTLSYYHIAAKFVCTYHKGADDSDRCTILHDCTHQLLDFLRPKRRSSESMWFEEGLAEFHSGVRTRRNDDGGLAYEFGQVNHALLSQIAKAVGREACFSLPVLFQCRTYGEAEEAFGRMFGGLKARGRDLLDCQGWSFIYFCMTGPNRAHRDSLMRYFHYDVGRGQGDYNTLMRAFRIDDHTQWAPIQREWRTFVDRLAR